jgi:hypothetical protein
MLSELVDLSMPVLPPGFPNSVTQAAPIPLDGPTTLQLALAGIATLGAYALLRRPKREPLAAKSRQATAPDATAPTIPSRDAA